MSKNKDICYNCKHAGDPFKIGKGTLTHVHCEHPDKEVRGEHGWGTLREYYNTCNKFEKYKSRSGAIVTKEEE